MSDLGRELRSRLGRCRSDSARGHSFVASSELPRKTTLFGEFCRWTASIQLIQPPRL